MMSNRTEIGYFFVFLSLLILISFLQPKKVLAAVRCETQYGGTQVCVTTGQLQINKKVCDPDLGSCDPASAGFNDRLVDNLGIRNHLFTPGEEVTFKLSIKNIGDAKFSSVAVADNPQPGFFQALSDPLSFNLANLNPGQTQDQIIRLKALDSTLLPQNNIICVVNSATAGAEGSGDRDTAQLCLKRKVLGEGVSKVPETGLPALAGVLSGLSLLLGFKLRKFSFRGPDKSMASNANYIYEMRKYLKSGGG